MACVALTSLMATIELEFVQPKARVRVSPHDRTLIISFIANLNGLQAEIQKCSSDDDVVVRDLEIEIRNFALKAEDDIEIQLSNILLAEDMEYRERAFHELIHQTLREAEKNAAQLLKRIIRESGLEQSSYVSGGKMADPVVALTILITKIKYSFLKPFSTLSFRHPRSIKSFFANLSSLQAFLQKESRSSAGVVLKDLEILIRDFALEAKDHIDIQLTNFLLAENTENRKNASQELLRTLRKAAGNAAVLSEIINSAINEANDKTQPLIHWSKRDSEFENAKELVGRDEDYRLLIW